MNDDAKAQLRLTCLMLAHQLAHKAGNESLVLEIAGKYYQFVLGSKPQLKVVSNDSGA